MRSANGLIHQAGPDAIEIKVGKLGPIKEGAVTLGGLTVIGGENCAGKTCLTYALYAIHQQFQDACVADISGEMAENPGITDKIINELNQEGVALVEIDVAQLVSRSIELSRRVVEKAEADLHETCNGDAMDFQDASIAAEYDRDQVASLIRHKLNQLEGLTPKGGLTLERRHGEDVLQVSLGKAGQGVTRTELSQLIDEHLLWHKPARPVIFMSQHAGRCLRSSELEQIRQILRGQLSEPSEGINQIAQHGGVKEYLSEYAKPVEDKYAYGRPRDSSKNGEEGLPEETRKRLLVAMEKIPSVRNGLIKDAAIRYPGPIEQREFTKPSHMATASVVDLMEMHRYFRQHAAQGDLLIIDEPESHLSHSNQVNIVRLFGECLAAGLNVLITTHSEIILKEINNLVMLHRLPAKARKRFVKAHAGMEGIDPDVVQAYYCDDGSVEKREVNRWGIDFPKFDIPHSELDDRAVALVSLLERSGHG